MTIQAVHAHPLPPAPAGQGRIHTPESSPGRPAPATRAAVPSHRSEVHSADPPAGTDPMLWSVLTGEERAFFARARALGSVTYGPGSLAASGGIPRGGRVDVRV